MSEIQWEFDGTADTVEVVDDFDDYAFSMPTDGWTLEHNESTVEVRWK